MAGDPRPDNGRPHCPGSEEREKGGDERPVCRGPSQMEWCDLCSTWRTKLDERTGWCRVCLMRKRYRNREEACLEALEAMKPKERERYLETETQRQMRVAPPKPKKAPAGSSDERENAEADYLAAVEEWELAKYKRLYDASKTRLRRMREKTGTNPRKGTRRPEGEEIQ